MKRIKSIDDTLDRLSALPDSLIHHILSFLEMRIIISTTLLSKRWKYLWITIPCLHFQDNYNEVVKFRNFVNRALMLWRGTYLRKFSIGFSRCYKASELSSDMDLWVFFAKERKVEELCIRRCAGLILEKNRLYHPPQCLYKYSSIRKLSLNGCNLQICGNVQWNCLNTLELSRCVISEDVINQIVSSPQLEAFSLHCIWECPNMSIRSSSLKKLSLYFVGRLPSNLMVLTIWAPNLEALELSDIPFKKCLLTDVSSLTEVNLELCSNWDAEDGKAFYQVLAAIQHVVTVKVSVGCFKMLGVMRSKYSFLPLLNVKLLRIFHLTELSELVGVLEIFPKIKMLIIDWRNSVGELFKLNAENYTVSDAKILKSTILQLRTAKITWYSYEPSIFQFIEFLLKHATMIEKIVIQKETTVELEDMFPAAQKVVTLQRSFPSVELVLCEK